MLSSRWGSHAGFCLQVSLGPSSHVPQAFLGAHFGYRQSLIASQLRSSVTAAVFRKALAVNAATLAATGSGRVQVRGLAGSACSWASHRSVQTSVVLAGGWAGGLQLRLESPRVCGATSLSRQAASWVLADNVVCTTIAIFVCTVPPLRLRPCLAAGSPSCRWMSTRLLNPCISCRVCLRLPGLPHCLHADAQVGGCRPPGQPVHLLPRPVEPAHPDCHCAVAAVHPGGACRSACPPQIAIALWLLHTQVRPSVRCSSAACAFTLQGRVLDTGAGCCKLSRQAPSAAPCSISPQAQFAFLTGLAQVLLLSVPSDQNAPTPAYRLQYACLPARLCRSSLRSWRDWPWCCCSSPSTECWPTASRRPRCR